MTKAVGLIRVVADDFEENHTVDTRNDRNYDMDEDERSYRQSMTIVSLSFPPSPLFFSLSFPPSPLFFSLSPNVRPWIDFRCEQMTKIISGGALTQA